MDELLARPIQYLPLTLDAPGANLAVDEALLEQVERGQLAGCLRIWEPDAYFVVLGRSSELEREVQLAACQEAGIGVWQRPSGGGVVLLGPGCLMVSLVLRLEQDETVRPIDQVHRFVLERHATALTRLDPTVRREGISDLTILKDNTPRKFSGNSLRLKRRAILYHGALLYDFHLPQIERFLGWPRRVPDYRQGRSHRDFVTNFPATRQQLTEALIDAWQAIPTMDKWPEQRTRQLTASNYQQQWPK